MKTGLRQSMTWLHTWIGLILCWLMYFMFVTGTVGYFDEEIDQYLTPEVAHHETASTKQRFISAVNYGQANAMTAPEWFIALEAKRGGLLSRIFYRTPSTEDGAPVTNNNVLLDPRTGESVDDIARETAGGQTLYRMHWRLHYINTDFSYYLIGVITLFMFIGVVSGIIIHRKIFTDFFTFRAQGNGKGWLDIHNLVSVSTLPFQLMISYSGLIFMITTFLPLIAMGSFGFDQNATRDLYQKLYPRIEVERSGVPAQMLDAEALYNQLSKKIDIEKVTSLRVKAPGDENAVVIAQVAENIYAARATQKFVFNATTGEFIETQERAINAAMYFNKLMLELHEGLFADIELRWLYFIAGTLGCCMMATGAIYYVRKRKIKVKPGLPLPKNLRNIEATNIAVVIGLLAAVAMFFNANRLLPIGMGNRADWEVHVMFITWLGCFIHAYTRPIEKAWPEQIFFAGLCCLLLPILNLLMLDKHIISTLAAGNWLFASVDLFFIACAGLFFYAARRFKNKASGKEASKKEIKRRPMSKAKMTPAAATRTTNS